LNINSWNYGAVYNTIIEVLQGCIDPEALNYSPNASIDDGSCEYPSTVCFDIEPNPNTSDPALTSFSKYIHVLDCFHIYGEYLISDEQMLHVAAVASELLDNNEDGIVDDPGVENSLRNLNAMMPLFNSDWSQGMENVIDHYEGCIGAVLFNDEIDPSQPGHWGYDASVEEILHTINNCGQVQIYPEAFSLSSNSSLLSDAMDIARGGQFINIPNQYPDEAWYHYDDITCDYECMAMEYLYWCIVSHLGILDDEQTCDGIDNEWELCTPELFESTDVGMYAVVTDPQYKLPQLAPDGKYCPAELSNKIYSVPKQFMLNTYPNPFNPITTIRYELPENGNVDIVVFDIQGRQVQTLIHGFQLQGHYNINWNASSYTSGVYLINMESSNFKKVQKVVLIK